MYSLLFTKHVNNLLRYDFIEYILTLLHSLSLTQYTTVIIRVNNTLSGRIIRPF